MAFFEPPPEREEPPPTPQPDWLQPPDNELGVSLTFRRVAVLTDAIAILVDGLVGYSTGFSFRLAGRCRPDADGRAPIGFDLMFHPRGGEPHERMSQLLLGVEFADGRRATTLRVGPSEDHDQQPTITNRGGGSGGGRFDTEYWVWPLPPSRRSRTRPAMGRAGHPTDPSRPPRSRDPRGGVAK